MPTMRSPRLRPGRQRQRLRDGFDAFLLAQRHRVRHSLKRAYVRAVRRIADQDVGEDADVYPISLNLQRDDLVVIVSRGITDKTRKDG